MSLSLESSGGDESLDLGGLGVGLSRLGGNLSSDNELSDVILLGQVEEFSDSGSSLGTESLGEGDVGETWKVLLSLRDNDDGKDTNVVSDKATSDGPGSTTCSILIRKSSPFSFAHHLVELGNKSDRRQGGVGHGVEQGHPVSLGNPDCQNILFETPKTYLLVVTTGNSEDVTCPLLTERVSWDLLTHLLLHEDSTEVSTNP